MKRRQFLQASLLGAASLILAGCGFRLRGYQTEGLGLEALSYVPADSELAPIVRNALINADIRLLADAPLRLNLGPERISETSLTHGDAGSQEIVIRLTAPFSVQRAEDGAYLLNQQQLDVETTLNVSDDNLLAQDNIRAEAHEQLRRDAARQLLDRLRPLAESQANR